MHTQVKIEIYSIILIIGAFQGIFFAILLMLKNRKRRPMNIHLSIILAAFGLQLFHQFLVESDYIYYYKSLVGITYPLDFISVIALYWYLRSITRPDKVNSIRQILRHYAIFPLTIPLIVPFWRLDFETKLKIAKGAFSVETWPDSITLSFTVLFAGFVVVFSGYLALSIRMLIQHKKRIRDVFSYREKITLNWLTYLLILFIGFWLIMVLYLSMVDDETQSILVLKYLCSFTTLSILYMGTMGLFQPRIYRRSQIPMESFGYAPAQQSMQDNTIADNVHRDTNSKNALESGMENTIDKPEKYQKSALSKADMQRIGEKLTRIMAEKSIYLEADLTMPKLATILSVSPNYLSQTLNELFQESFFDFINRYRIEYAKEKLAEKEHFNTAIVDIAMASAFNSKSAFYSAFKKYTGTTPSEFRKSLPVEC